MGETKFQQLISKVVGIDLGAANSAVAVMNPTDTDIIIHRDQLGKETTPSYVWKDPNTNEVLVGDRALRHIGTTPEPVRWIKQSMGKKTKVMLSDEEISPERFSAYILEEMKRQIETEVSTFNTNDTSWIVDRAIITVPVYFDPPQIDVIRKAAELAGLEVVELLYEPAAVAHYYCWKTGTQNGIFLVYDLGSASFTASVLRVTEGVLEVLGFSGNTHLGGDNLDAALARNLQERLLREAYALELNVDEDPEDEQSFELLKFLAESVKKALSTSEEYLLRDTNTLKDKKGKPVIIEALYRRLDFEELVRPIVARTIPYCFEALEKAREKTGVTLADVDAVILSGGCTHIPLVREMVRRALCADSSAGEPRAKCSEPVYEKVDTIVALGAAIRAAAVGGLAVYDPERTIKAFFNSLRLETKEILVTGKLVTMNSNLSLPKRKIRIRISELEHESEAVVGEDGHFRLKVKPPVDDKSNRLEFEVIDNRRKTAFQVRLAIHTSPNGYKLIPVGKNWGSGWITVLSDDSDPGYIRTELDLPLLNRYFSLPISDWVISNKKEDNKDERTDSLKLLLQSDSFLRSDWVVTQSTTGTSPDTPISLTIPERIGPYKILDELGRGAFTVVCLAEDSSSLINRKVALKIPFQKKKNDESWIALLKREIAIWRELSKAHHRNILYLEDVKQIDNFLIFVTEYMDGGNLAVNFKGLTPSKRVSMVILTLEQICEGLTFAHRRHKPIVHGDIKPQNILVSKDLHRVKLGDFGLSFFSESSSHTHTDSRRIEIVGTQMFLAPESFDGVKSTQTDIYALGVTLYYLLTGELPFRRFIRGHFPTKSNPETREELKRVKKERENFKVQLCNSYPEIPRWLEEAVQRCMAPDPASRFQDAGEFLEFLLPYVNPSKAQKIVLTALGNMEGQFIDYDLEIKGVKSPEILKVPVTRGTISGLYEKWNQIGHLAIVRTQKISEGLPTEETDKEIEELLDDVSKTGGDLILDVPVKKKLQGQEYASLWLLHDPRLAAIPWNFFG
ncbi:MAG: hypothetical protein D6732_25910 [Methanobacteriota archaeon]|nr:MAG: hypothetical protein D6732_25910 [Euryarchaeota archaeon]